MIKLRLTYHDEEEKQAMLLILRESCTVVSESKPYPLRGKNDYKNIYVDIEV